MILIAMEISKVDILQILIDQMITEEYHADLDAGKYSNPSAECALATERERLLNGLGDTDCTDF